MKFAAMRRISVAVMTFAMLALALYAMYTLVSFNRDLRMNGQGFLPAAVYGKRYDPIKPLLPADSVIRYVTDVPHEDTRPYYQARFVLAPVRVAWEGDYDIAIGDFKYMENVAPVLRREGYVIENNLGNGLFLLKKRTK
jgi:hypothetical protein